MSGYFPCKDCLDRCVGCHSRCDKYIDCKHESDIMNEYVHGYKSTIHDYDSYKMNLFLKIRKYRGGYKI